MEWWLKASLTLFGVSSVLTANHFWKEHYRKLGVEHPITRFLRSQMTNEEEDRLKRIHELKIQSDLSEARLSKISKVIPTRFGGGIGSSVSGGISNKLPVENTAWKSDF